MKTILITGANRGLGLAHVRTFASRGIHVFATARVPDESIELTQLATLYAGLVDVLQYDAADPEAPSRLKAIVGDTPLDLLFCNAGVMGESGQSLGSIDVFGILDIVRINSLAPLKLVEALTDNVACSKRKLVAFQSSLMGSIGDNGSGGRYGYRISKCALNMIAKGVANDLRSRGVISVALHPGWVKTRMGGQQAPLTLGLPT
jgi:NAD(P)-dependent dehydrogenase (short-subunit alcohol dehydrogenase family)